MLINWIPIGYHRSYTITIRVKAAELRDLKYEKEKTGLHRNTTNLKSQFLINSNPYSVKIDSG